VDAVAIDLLLVDDSTVTRAVISKALRLAGIEINELHQAGDGEKALAILADRSVDLVFTGLGMPRLDGEALIGRLHDTGVLPDTPVVVVSSLGGDERVARLYSRGVRDFIRKPFTPERIRDAAAQVLEVKADAH
jgi:two-component system chemotaxis response regulator CheY